VFFLVVATFNVVPAHLHAAVTAAIMLLVLIVPMRTDGSRTARGDRALSSHQPLGAPGARAARPAGGLARGSQSIHNLL
jgi:hypothetical protein